MTAPPLPVGLLFGTVRWIVVGVAEDSTDPGSAPDPELITGSVTFRPVVPSIKFVGTLAEPAPKTILPRAVTYNLVNGVLKDQSGNSDISLVANDSPATSPTGWQYQVEYQLDDGYTFGSFRITLLAGTIVDLTLALPQPDADLVLYTSGPAGTIEIGTVTTLAPGSPATVTNVGSPQEAVLDLALPAGSPGVGVPPGGTANQLLVKGTGSDYDTAWVSGTSTATPNSFPRRDAAGRLQVVDGAAAADVATKGQVDASTALAVPLTQKGAVNGVATLDAGGKVPQGQIPQIALHESRVVASQAAMLALADVQPGDLAIRTDGAGSFILTALPASTLANWQVINAPTDVVTSVAGRQGVVVLVKADVGLANVDNTADSAKPVSTAQQTALDAKITRAFTKRSTAVSYTLVAADAIDMVIHSTAAAGITITVPQDSDAVIGQEIAIPWRQFGAGQITFAAGTGATLISRGSVFKSAGQNAEGVLTKVAANTWLLSGDIVA